MELYFIRWLRFGLNDEIGEYSASLRLVRLRRDKKKKNPWIVHWISSCKVLTKWIDVECSHVILSYSHCFYFVFYAHIFEIHIQYIHGMKYEVQKHYSNGWKISVFWKHQLKKCLSEEEILVFEPHTFDLIKSNIDAIHIILFNLQSAIIQNKVSLSIIIFSSFIEHRNEIQFIL